MIPIIVNMMDNYHKTAITQKKKSHRPVPSYFDSLQLHLVQLCLMHIFQAICMSSILSFFFDFIKCRYPIYSGVFGKNLPFISNFAASTEER